MKNLTKFIKENNINEALISQSTGLTIPKEFTKDKSKIAQGIADFDTLINQIKAFARSCDDKAIHNPDMGKLYRKLYKDFPQLNNYDIMKSSKTLRDFIVDNAENLDLVSYIYFTFDELKRTGRDKTIAKEILAEFERNKVDEEEARKVADSVIVIRSADGDGEVYFYTGLTDENVNRIKYAYTKMYDTNYYDTRPCTFKYWDNLDAQHKYAARKK